MDYSTPGSSVHGTLQTRILEWIAIPSSRDLPNPGIEPGSPTLQDDSLLSEPPGKSNIHLSSQTSVSVGSRSSHVQGSIAAGLTTDLHMQQNYLPKSPAFPPRRPVHVWVGSLHSSALLILTITPRAHMSLLGS